MNTQNEQVAIKEDMFWKIKRFFKIPRLYVSLLENKDKSRAIFFRGFHKHESNFMMDSFAFQEKESVELYFFESIGIFELIKSLFVSLLNK